MRVVRTAFKYFAYGLLVGLFFAPRRGDETRQAVLNWIGTALGGLIGVQGDEVEANV